MLNDGEFLVISRDIEELKYLRKKKKPNIRNSNTHNNNK